jgi:Ras-related protein Rab-11A
VRAQVWDTCGQERFRSISGLYFKAAVGAMLVYDITSRDSFENVSKWMAQIKEKADPSIVMILIGNKSDLADRRQVKMDEAMRFAEINCN